MYFACRKAAEVSNSSMTTSVRPFVLQCLNFLTWWIKIIKSLCILKHSTSECWEALEWIPNSSSGKNQSMWSMKNIKTRTDVIISVPILFLTILKNYISNEKYKVRRGMLVPLFFPLPPLIHYGKVFFLLFIRGIDWVLYIPVDI